jgi:hypothetical protein
MSLGVCCGRFSLVWGWRGAKSEDSWFMVRLQIEIPAGFQEALGRSGCVGRPDDEECIIEKLVSIRQEDGPTSVTRRRPSL